MNDWPSRRFRITHAFEHGMFLRRLEGDSPRGTVLYVHGLGESALCFERLMADSRLARWTHLAADLVGYGKSSWAVEPLSLAQHADRLDQLLEYLAQDPGPFVILGHSMGGVIATLLAERATSRVRALVNVEGNISPADCHFSSQAARFDLATWLARGRGEVLDGLYLQARTEPTVLRPYCASVQICDPRAFHKNSRELVALSGDETLARRMAAIERPRVYVFGAPRGSGDQSRGLLHEARVEMVGIPDSGHWPFLDHHNAFVDELAAFLDGLPE